MKSLREIEEQWNRAWQAARLFEADPSDKPKYFLTFPFPYVNGAAHLGHAYTFIRLDTIARYKRARGFNVLFPFGFHATGEPITGVAQRLKNGDQKQRQILMDAGVPEENLKDFEDPRHIVNYWKAEFKKDITRLGGSIDWRRSFVTTALTPTFSRFIEWQYTTLRKKGYVVQGTHPVVYCPHDDSPTGDHDRLKGEGASPEEYTLLKFRFGHSVLPAATFRPETIFGVTNLWLNPEAEYAKAEVDGEEWIVSRPTLEKLKHQNHEVRILGGLKGAELIGKTCTNPVNNSAVPILPATFVDEKSGTGVVMSVPAHAPYDWIALKDLTEDEKTCRRFSLEPTAIKQIKPIGLIKIGEFGEAPAVEICDSMAIANQKETEKLEKATSTIYKKEFHTGVLNPRTGKYAGLKVSECKETLVKDFTASGFATALWDTVEEVVCRCGTPCLVKILKDQWFLKFSDQDWKDKVLSHIAAMEFYPPVLRTQFENTVEWLKDKACARKSGLGTPLPWDKGWIVETLSDSVIYMAYYTIAKHINAHGITADQLSDEVFEFLFSGTGDLDSLAKKSGIDSKVISEMRQEFDYWYPVDLRGSGKDLIQNHLTFYLFHHVALFNGKYWPKAIEVNGFVNVESDKMSKSKGNFITMRNALDTYGADATRFGLMYAAEGIDDPDWNPHETATYIQKLRGFLQLVDELGSLKDEKNSHLDRWLLSRLQKHIAAATAAYENLRTRLVVQTAFFDSMNDVKWYLKRGGKNKEVLRASYRTIAQMMAPVTPHLAEEVWAALDGKGFVFQTGWPKPEGSKIDSASEEGEELVARTLHDIEEIRKLVKATPKEIILIVAPSWKHRLAAKLRELGKPDIPAIMTDQEFKSKGAETVGLVQKLAKQSGTNLTSAQELEVLNGAIPFLKTEVGLSVTVQSGDAPSAETQPKVKAAMPGKPAILLVT